MIRYIDLAPILIAFWTELITTLVMIVWQWDDLRKSVGPLLNDRFSLYSLIAFGVLRAVDRVAFATAVVLAPIAKVLTLVYLFPIYTLVLAHWLLDERVTGKLVLAAFTALAGAIVMIVPDLGMSPASRNSTVGLLLAVLVSLTVSVRRIILKSVDDTVATPLVLLTGSAVATCTLAPIVPMIEVRNLTRQAVALLLVSGTLHGVIGQIVMLTGLRIVAASRAAVLGYLEPVAGALLSWWLLAEQPSWPTAIGGTLILAGSAVCVVDSAKMPSPAPSA
jgi:drug/metabolite transporter (DMT)-like permease